MTAIDRRAKGMQISGRYGAVVKGHNILFKNAVRKLARNPTLPVKQVLPDFNVCPQYGDACLYCLVNVLCMLGMFLLQRCAEVGHHLRRDDGEGAVRLLSRTNSHSRARPTCH